MTSNKPKHRGRFKWRKYSAYNGNLKGYWTDRTRTTERHRKEEECQSPSSSE